MKLLTEYADGTNAQFGEDGIIYECLKRMERLDSGIAVDVGASDGREISNTLHLRDAFNWNRVLIEADPIIFSRIEEHPLDTAINKAITPKGKTSIDALVPGGCDFLSLDIDGDEYAVLENLKMRPILICAEFNQTIPWKFDITGSNLGCSLSAMIRLMERKGYKFIGATHCNAFFVQASFANSFEDIDTCGEHYLDERNFTYLITTTFGGSFAIGPQIFGTTKRFAGELQLVTPSGDLQTLRLSDNSLRPN
jgi:hypothetical protein